VTDQEPRPSLLVALVLAVVVGAVIALGLPPLQGLLFR